MVNLCLQARGLFPVCSQRSLKSNCRVVLVDSARGLGEKEGGETEMAESKKGGRKEGRAWSDRKFSNIFLAKVNQERWRCAAYAETFRRVQFPFRLAFRSLFLFAWNESPKALGIDNLLISTFQSGRQPMIINRPNGRITIGTETFRGTISPPIRTFEFLWIPKPNFLEKSLLFKPVSVLVILTRFDRSFFLILFFVRSETETNNSFKNFYVHIQ